MTIRAKVRARNPWAIIRDLRDVNSQLMEMNRSLFKEVEDETKWRTTEARWANHYRKAANDANRENARLRARVADLGLQVGHYLDVLGVYRKAAGEYVRKLNMVDGAEPVTRVVSSGYPPSAFANPYDGKSAGVETDRYGTQEG